MAAAAIVAVACSGPETTTAPASTTPTTAPATTAAPTSPPTTAAPSTTLAPDEQPAPLDATALAAELSFAEQSIRDTSLDDQLRAAWGRRQQRLYRQLAVNEEWAEETLRLVDPDVADAVNLNWTARKELSGLGSSGPLSTKLPAWRIRDPLPVNELRSFYDEAATATGIDWEYLAGINLVETRMGRIEGLSTAGATGPMQFLPSTWEECCEGDPTVDRDAIIGAATYLNQRGGPEDMAKALQGYNNSGYYVRAVTAYADVLRADPDALWGYHAWEVFFRSEAGLVRIPTGYNEPEAIDAAAWIAANPQHVVN